MNGLRNPLRQSVAAGGGKARTAAGPMTPMGWFCP